MDVRSIRLAALALACTATAAAQAAVEYAARSSASAVSSAGSDLQMGVCPVNASLFRCMRDYYPLTFKVCVVGICLILAAAIMRSFRSVR